MKQKPELSFKANLSWTGIDAVALGVNTGNQIIKSQVLIGLQQLLNFDYTNSFTQWPDFSGKAGEILEVPVSHPKFPISRIYLVGVGEGASSDLRKAGAALGRKVKSSGKVVLDACLAVRKSPTSREREAAVAHSVALVSSSYLWNLKTASTGVPAKFIIFGNLEAEVGYARTLSTAVWRARDLIHTPSNIKNPAWMAVQAKSMITRSKSSDLKIEVISGAALKEFGGLYAIGNSSPKPGPRFIKVSYAPKGSRNWPHVVLVGKGITYDTGGISLKRPYDVMQPMKSDMSGAAAVLSTVIAMPEIKPRVRVTALLMCAENSLSGTSTRPSDVITQYGGTTVEVINTDAEGRLVLADGLAYADKNLDPTYLIDVATLTGAATLGLSRHYAAMYSQNSKLLTAFTRVGDRIGDRVWPMPLVDEYRISLQSTVADFNHTAEKPDFKGGSITAALFLEHFAGKRNWVHFDIAGPARADNDAGENPKGGTAFGVRLLIDWIATL